MTGYFLRRFLLIIPTFIGITLAVFLVMNFVPGGPVERQIMRYKMAMANEGGISGGAPSVDIPEDAIQEMRHYYGFDKPVYTRYFLWLWKVLHLDLGRSYIYQDPVWDVIKARFPVSLFLGLTGFFLSYLVCIPLGVFKAIRHGSRFDLLSSLAVFLGYSNILFDLVAAAPTASNYFDQWLDGGKQYTLHVPKDAPVAQFWSFTVYDNESRCFVDTGSYPDRSSRDDIVKNADGSVDLYFGPTPPKGKPQSNWIKTLPKKGWFTYFRLYGPTQAYFDKTWVLPDIQPT